uniref:Ras-GAP domain-containing protein n=1 Tax=Caenorhabditis tropicalis TaxID=1561998 RepID=A0A1I7TR04_9PELO
MEMGLEAISKFFRKLELNLEFFSKKQQRIIQVTTRTFDLLNLLIHDSYAIDGFVKSDGLSLICQVVNYRHPDVTRAGFKLLLHVSDSRALSLINLKDILPFIITRIRENVRDQRRHEEDNVVYCGTGFLSNAVANQQPVKELAIANDAINLLYEVILKYTPINELRETLRRNPVCEIISNTLRTLNNFLMMWIPIQNRQMAEAAPSTRQQVCRFLEPDVMKRLMTCLSIEGCDIQPMMELRSTILRFFLLLLRTPFIPKAGLLNVTDDARKRNIVEHICTTFSWAMGQPINDRNREIRHQLIERVFNLLVRLIEQCGAASEVALSFYAIQCPLSLLSGDLAKPMFVLNVLLVCDQILMHNPSVANVWSVDRPLLEVLKNHLNSDIERAASAVLSKLPEVDPLAAILSNC